MSFPRRGFVFFGAADGEGAQGAVELVFEFAGKGVGGEWAADSGAEGGFGMLIRR